MPTQPDREAKRGVLSWKLVQALIAAGAVLIAYLYARRLLGTTFKMYDDEGYVMLSLDHYLRGGHLYTAVYSQYGPFYFYAQSALFRLFQLPVNHDAGRLVTLVLWLLSAGLGGYFVYRVSRDGILAAASVLALAVLVRNLCFEPGHPQQVILPLLMLSCCAATASGRAPFLLLGAVGAALFFTKINVGVFYAAALAHALICRLPESGLRTAAAACSMLYALAFPVLLMQRHLPGAAAAFCLLASVAGAATFLIALLSTPPAKRPMHGALLAGAGAGAGAILICAEAIREGISPTTLFEGVVAGPLRHPGVYSVLLPVAGIQAILAVVVAMGVFGLHHFRSQWRDRSDWVGALPGVIGLCAVPLLAVSPANCAWILPFLPVGLLVLPELEPSDALPRVFVACLSATQFLQAYPIAGTQVAIASAPLMLWALVCVHDGAVSLFRLFRRRAIRAGGLLPLPGGLLALGFASAMVGSGATSLAFPAPASALPGTHSLHLPLEREAGYEFLAAGIRANCDILFTLPGMGSFNFWSGVPTPNGSNLTAWVKGFSRERQQEILDILAADPRACAVYNQEMAGGWGDTPEELARLPLARFITLEMPRTSERLGYEIHVHPRRNSPWIGGDSR